MHVLVNINFGMTALIVMYRFVSLFGHLAHFYFFVLCNYFLKQNCCYCLRNNFITVLSSFKTKFRKRFLQNFADTLELKSHFVLKHL